MSLKAEDVKAYLLAHPEFFEDHADLVTSLRIPTDTGSAISLVEFQLRKLRDQVSQLERENDHMIETARINSVLFEKTRSLVLALLDARDLEDLAVALDEKLGQGFDIPEVRLLLSDQFKVPSQITGIQPIAASDLSDGGSLAHALSDQNPWIGRLDKARRTSLFGSAADGVESAAALGLVRGHTYGLLALGHPDPTHFQSNQDTLFLDHIGEALAMILPRLLKRAK